MRLTLREIGVSRTDLENVLKDRWDLVDDFNKRGEKITEMQSLKGGEEVRLNLEDGCLYDESGQRHIPEFVYEKSTGKKLTSNGLFANEDVNKWLENNNITDIICAGVLPFPNKR